MSVSVRLITGLLLAIALTACDSMELTIGVEEERNAELTVTNANPGELADVRLVVEAVESDNSTTLCAEKALEVWRPGEPVSVPRCGDKIRLTLYAGAEVARFSYANGELFRRIGRKEVPVRSSSS